MKNRIYFRPLYLAVLLFLISIFFIYEAVTTENLAYDFEFIGYGGTYKYHDIKLLGIPAYWFMMILGLIISIVVSFNQRKRYDIGKTKAIIIPLVFLLVSFLGGKLLYVLENLSSVTQNGIRLSGMSLFGAIFMVPLVITIVSGFKKEKIAQMLDYCTPFGIILLSCVRIGCFINGCCGATTIWNDINPIILPVQLIEVTFDLMILELCSYIENFNFKSGLMYPTFMISYGFCRFILEFLRKTPKEILFFSNGQLFAIACVILGMIFLKIFSKNNKKGNSLFVSKHQFKHKY